MTANPIEAAMRRMLNDRRVFWMVEVLIQGAKWSEFRDALNRGDRSQATAILESTEKTLDSRITNERDDTRKRHLVESKKLLSGLKLHVIKQSALIRDLVQRLDTFGTLRPNFPNLEDFGKVIEGHSRSIAEQFFLYPLPGFEWVPPRYCG